MATCDNNSNGDSLGREIERREREKKMGAGIHPPLPNHHQQHRSMVVSSQSAVVDTKIAAGNTTATTSYSSHPPYNFRSKGDPPPHAHGHSQQHQYQPVGSAGGGAWAFWDSVDNHCEF